MCRSLSFFVRNQMYFQKQAYDCLILQICDFGLARIEEPDESVMMTQEVKYFETFWTFQTV